MSSFLIVISCVLRKTGRPICSYRGDAPGREFGHPAIEWYFPLGSGAQAAKMEYKIRARGQLVDELTMVWQNIHEMGRSGDG